MITQVFTDFFDGKYDLNIGSNLFAETPSRSQFVLFKAPSTYKLGQIDSLELRKSYCKCFVQGYGILEGATLAERLMREVYNIRGSFVISNPEMTETYEVKDIDVKILPHYVSDEGLNVYVFDFEVKYSQKIT